MNSLSLKEFCQNLARRFPLIIIDECQDLSQIQLLILEKLTDVGVKLHFIGDLNQSIYEFRNSDPKIILDFINDLKFESFHLTKNHRSVQSIVNLCTKLVSGNKVQGRKVSNNNSCVVLEYSSCPTEVLPTYTRLSKHYKNSVIVARGHSTLNKFNTSASKLNEIQKLALAIVLFDQTKFDRLEESINLFSHYLRTLIKENIKPLSFNCPDSIDSPLMWRVFLYKALLYLVEDNLNDATLTWKAWSGKAKLRLRNMIDQPFVSDDIAISLNALLHINIRSPNKLGGESLEVSLKVVKNSSSSLRKETVHQVKGETHDASMLVSSPGRQGGVGANWKEWLDDPNSEAARLAYVASSRPKELLIWAVKQLKPKEKEQLKDVGFLVMPLD